MSSHYGSIQFNMDVDKNTNVNFVGYGEVRISSRDVSPMRQNQPFANLRNSA